MVGHTQDILAMLVMAVALGMDAFSLSLGIGLAGITRQKAMQLCTSVGAFHIALTLLGIYAGLLLENLLGSVATRFGAFLLIGLGVHTLLTALMNPEEKAPPFGHPLALFAFAASVSLDSLSVGFSLGLRSTAYGIVSAIIFGVMSMFLCGVGILIGRRFRHVSGKIGEVVGASVLIGFGTFFLLKP